MGVFVGAVEAGAGRRELEAVHGEGEVVVVRVVDEEAVVRVLLQALGVVALGDERARVTGVRALLDARRLANILVKLGSRTVKNQDVEVSTSYLIFCF